MSTKIYFSSRGALLDLMSELRAFTSEELLAKYRRSEAGQKDKDSDEALLDYLEQLVTIDMLEKSGDKYTVKPSPTDED